MLYPTNFRRLTGPEFWTNVDFGVLNVPASCCANAEEDATVCLKTDAYQDGCMSSSEDLVKKALTIMIVVIVVIILLQIICMILAWCSKGGRYNSTVVLVGYSVIDSL